MDFLVATSTYIIPLVIFFIVGYGVLNKTDVYDVFVEGAKDGMKTVWNIAPTLIGLMVAVGVLRTSGFLDFLGGLLAPVTEGIGFPSELVPLTLVKMFSSSAATGLLLDVFKEFGTDSYVGLIASIMLSCTETIFYTMSIYFLTAKITKTRWTLPGALVATLAGVITSVIIVNIF
ncbi:MAG: spore maturation protein [Lachnospira sp.]|nr:spore maturation protein [Lachnospira sp.]